MESTMLYTGLSLVTLLLIPLVLEFLRENMALIVSLCFIVLLWQWVAPHSLPLQGISNSMDSFPQVVTQQMEQGAQGLAEVTEFAK